MSEQEEEQTKEDRSADALAAMAAGEGLWPDSKGEPPAPPAEQVLGAAAQPASPQEIVARRARAYALRSKARQVRDHQFRNLMIPMLLVSAVLLLILATVAAVMLPSADEAYYQPDNLLGRPWAKYLVYAAFPLALILLAGAAIFWQDVRRGRIESSNEGG